MNDSHLQPLSCTGRTPPHSFISISLFLIKKHTNKQTLFVLWHHPVMLFFPSPSLLNSTVSLPQASPDLWHVVMFVLWLSSPLVVTSSTSQKVGVDVGAIQHKNLSVRMMIVETTCRTRGNIQSIYEGKVRSDFMHALSKSVVSLSRLQMSARRV